MYLKQICLLAILLTATSAFFAQGTFMPRDADEEHAWRLYNQYIASKKLEAQLKAGIAQKSGDIKTTNVGVIPLYIDPQDVSELANLRRRLQAEQEKQDNLEGAWDRKFSDRYGNLRDSQSTIYDPRTKKRMDKIQFRLMAFPFNTVDGTYEGTATGIEGTITLIVSGTSVTGTMNGTLKKNLKSEEPADIKDAGNTVESHNAAVLRRLFRSLDDMAARQGLALSANVAGTKSASAKISGRISGVAGKSKFTGTFTGVISEGVASGSWKGSAPFSSSGTFTAAKE